MSTSENSCYRFICQNVFKHSSQACLKGILTYVLVSSLSTFRPDCSYVHLTYKRVAISSLNCGIYVYIEIHIYTCLPIFL